MSLNYQPTESYAGNGIPERGTGMSLNYQPTESYAGNGNAMPVMAFPKGGLVCL